MAARKPGRPAPEQRRGKDTRFMDLRRRAEEALQSGVPGPELPIDTKKLIQELHVHQIELEMQNEELREAQEKIQETTAKYYDLYEFAPVGYLTLDKAGMINEANMTLSRMFGEAKKDLLNRFLTQFILPEDRSLFASHLRKVFSTDLLQRAEVRIRRERGDIIHVALHSIADNAGNFCRAAAIDVTQLRIAEQKLRSANDRLRLLTAELSRNEEITLRQIAEELHDCIGQNLAAIKMRVDLISQSPRKTSKALDEIRSMLKDTIRNTRSLTFEVSPSILYELGFESSIEWLAEKLSLEHHKQIQLNIENIPKVEREMEIVVFRMIRELLMNSIKHSGVDEINLNLFREGPFLGISVSDRGKGFDPAQIEAALSGFGLFSIRERIHALGGEMIIDSRPGTGARVNLLIPSLSP